MKTKVANLFVALGLALVLSACGIADRLTSQDLVVNNKCSSSMDIFLNTTKLGLAVRNEKTRFTGISPQTYTVKAFLLNGTLFTQETTDFSKGSWEWILCP